MALLHVAFFSRALVQDISMEVILPEQKQYPDPQPRREYPVLYLLHGLSDDQSAWQRKSRVEQYVKDLPLVVVMPTTHRAFYTNTVTGQKYFDFVSRELPAVCRAMFPIRAGRENTFAAGLSMGGYGAFKLGILCPEQYGAVASLSGVLALAQRMPQNVQSKQVELSYIFGKDLEGSENDLVFQARKLIESGRPLPRFYQACGRDDSLYENNQFFYREFGKELAITYEEGPGAHTWDFWDAYIQRVLAWLPIEK